MRHFTAWLLGGFIAAGCAVGAEDNARPIDLVVESGFLDQAATEPGANDGDLVAVSIYLVRNDRLVHLTREVAADNSNPETVVAVTLAGPTPAEAGAGIRSAIPASTRVGGIQANGDVAEIDLSASFATIGGLDEILAVAQLVMSVTSLPGVETVTLRLNGADTSVPRPDGVLISGPLSSDDYSELVSP